MMMEGTSIETVPTLTVVRHSAVEAAVTMLRRRETPAQEFRAATRTVARALAYEATRDLPLEEAGIETPVAPTSGSVLSCRVIAVPILRAGLGMLDGFIDMLPTVAVGFVGMRRDEETLLPHEYYRNVPDPVGAHLFLLDPMLATGGSVVAALGKLPVDKAASTSLLSVIAAPEGVAAVARAFPGVRIFTGALDDRLNEHGYIVPGLGDAGDRLWDTI